AVMSLERTPGEQCHNRAQLLRGACIPRQTPSRRVCLFLRRRVDLKDECAWRGEFQRRDYHWPQALCRLRLALFLSRYQDLAEKEWQSSIPGIARDSKYAYVSRGTRSGPLVVQARVRLFAHLFYSAMPQGSACDNPGCQYNIAR